MKIRFDDDRKKIRSYVIVENDATVRGPRTITQFSGHIGPGIAYTVSNQGCGSGLWITGYSNGSPA